jgi:hypothetical protein
VKQLTIFFSSSQLSEVEQGFEELLQPLQDEAAFSRLTRNHGPHVYGEN